MKAIRVAGPGGPEVLRYEDVPDPVPKEGEALVRVEAAGLNFIDVYLRTGLYKMALPGIPGQEAAGTVVRTGPGVTGVKEGDRVAYADVLGAYAELAAVPTRRLVPVPAGLSTKEAAAAMLQGITAHYLAHSTFPLSFEHGCLVHAAAGGVGLLLCQIAKRLGAAVIGTVSTAEKAALARGAGADATINYAREDFVAEVRRMTGGRGVHVVYDSVGQATFLRSLDCLAPRGSLVLYGQSSGPVSPLDPKILNQKGGIFLTRPSLAQYTATRGELLGRVRELFGWIATGALNLQIFAEIPLRDAAEAHRMLEGRKTAGKVLIIP